MALKESDMRAKVVKMLRSLHACSVENAVGVPGMPDVAFTGGWLELKSVDLPARPDTKVAVEHFTPQQKIWLRKHAAAGGVALMLIKAGPWWLLFDGEMAVQQVGKVPLHRLVDDCIYGWHGTPDKEELVQCLKRICHLVSDCTSSAGDASSTADKLPLNTESLLRSIGRGSSTSPTTRRRSSSRKGLRSASAT